MTTDSQRPNSSPAPAPLINLLANQRYATGLSFVLITIMLTCATVPFIELGKRLVPTWQGDYLLVAVAVFAIEALLSSRVANKIPLFSVHWLLYRFAEVVVLFSGLKLYIVLHNSLSHIATDDLPVLGHEVASIFNTEFIFAGVMCLAVWAAATYFASAVNDLEGDDLLYAKNSDSPVESDRGKARKQLLADIFLVGALMLFVTAIVRSDLSFMGVAQPVVPTGLFNVVLYFVFGLILFAQSQFAVLRARWSLDRVPLAHNLALRWAAYALSLLIICAGLVIFLPTRYTLGLLDTLAYLFNIINFIISFLLLLVWLPIRYLMSLFGHGDADLGPIPSVVPTPPPPGTAPDPVPGSEIIKSIFFWVTFLAVLFFSIYYYFLRRTALFQDLSKSSNLSWLAKFWKWLTGSLRGIQVQVTQSIQQVIRRIRPLQTVAPWSFVNVRRLPPREQVRFYYLALLRRADVPRRPSQTPSEYQAALQHLPPEDLKGLTESFIEARYTPHPITTESAGLARYFWENLRKAIRRVRGPRDTDAEQ